MAGHMRFGVVHEDIALTHFTIYTGHTVTKVGSIKVSVNYISRLGIKLGILKKKYRNDTLDYLLISPDGLVGKSNNISNNVSISDILETDKLIGMLEIKCISPFHHISCDNKLEWIDDMKTRQWTNSYQIPFVYVIQIALQVIMIYG